MRIEDLGRRDYDSVHALQKKLVAEVQADPSKAWLLLVEHDPVITIGRFGSERNVLEPGGIPVRRVERGGDVTYHGPGQLVGYVIYDLYVRKLSIKEHVCRLQQGLQRVLAEYGIEARSRERMIGLWVGERKIASLGIAVSRRVTYHGFALNVNTDLSAFARINPCGMPGCPMTSIARELGRPADMEDVKRRVALAFRSSGSGFLTLCNS